ncbi:MAG: hypothetical protein EXR71_08995 [Myxococcales bacterium]|nr:hypothetical protein [Myxococcales bacterium]
MLLSLLLFACGTPDSDNSDDSGNGGATAADRDGDGVPDDADCEPDNANVYPGHYEVPYNGVDEDCDGADVTDVDGDGHIGERGDGDDCDDSNPNVYPGHVEICYDLLDNNCDDWEGGNDCDGDGYDISHDCWDDESKEYPNEAGLTPADVNDSAIEVWYDGTDADCAGDNDWDQDHDGQETVAHAGGDCDDLNELINTGMDELWNDYDDDCDDVVDDISVSVSTSRASADSGTGEDLLGHSIVFLPDLDADGRSDFAVSAPGTEGYDDEGEVYAAGRVWILSSTNGITTPKSEGLSVIEGFGYTGYAMSLTDITGETTLAIGSATGGNVAFYALDDLSTGAEIANVDHDAAGAALLVPESGSLVVGCGAGNGAVLVSTWTSLSGSQGLSAADFSATSEEDYTCLDTALLGDLDGDGFGEVLVGMADELGTSTLRLLSSSQRRSGGVASILDLQDYGAYTYGLLFSTLPDVDGNGYDEAMITDSAANANANGDGRVWIVDGSAFTADWAAVAMVTVSGGVDGAGLRPNSLGDLDDDGDDDLIVGLPGAGLVYFLDLALLRGGGDVVPSETVPNFFDLDRGNRFGDIAWAQDIDADGRDDVMVRSAESPGKVSTFLHE